MVVAQILVLDGLVLVFLSANNRNLKLQFAEAHHNWTTG